MDRVDAVEMESFHDFRQQGSYENQTGFSAFGSGLIQQIVVAMRVQKTEIADLRDVCSAAAPDVNLSGIDVFQR